MRGPNPNAARSKGSNEMVLIVEHQPTPNFGNFILLILSVWGAIADNRYKAKGGKREPEVERKYLLLGAAVVLVILIALGYNGVSAGALGSLTGNLLVWIFAAYEARRFWVRRNNPLMTFKK
jgi:hypothetical protein